jgi:ABC-2 type transport system ATP-binding protein
MDATAAGLDHDQSMKNVIGTGPPAIMTDGLTKRYGRRVVVDQLDLRIPTGVVAGLIGPNGAGKTTTLRILLGLVRPDQGTATVLGQPLAAVAGYLPRVGALIEQPAFYPGLSGERNLAVYATLAGFDPAQIPVVLDRLGLAARATSAYRTYSLGMRQRLGIAAALLGDPALVILDEPTNGLDPAGIRDMRGIIRSINDDGRTVLVASHLLNEVQQVCDWLIVLDDGQRRFEGPTGELIGAGDGAGGDLEEQYFRILREGRR